MVTSIPGPEWLFIVPAGIFVVLTIFFTLCLRCLLKRRASCLNAVSTVSEAAPIIVDLEAGQLPAVPRDVTAVDTEIDWCLILEIRT